MLFKRSAGGWTQLGSTYASGALATGTRLKVEAVGSTIAFLENGNPVITATDTSFTGGAPGIISYGTGSADNWSGGTANAFSVGGSVSGLSGGVTLQDNDGDDLTVTVDGGFTFGRSLIEGAAYDVTVERNPAGQTCAVAGGSGAIGSARVTDVVVTCADSSSGGGGRDDFNRADGPLGSNWTDMSDGGMAVT